MTTAITPIKRSKELAPLSREHHEGLLFVWKIRHGINKGVDPKRIALFCSWFWKNHLKAHFQKEEADLGPILSCEHPALVKMLDEHEAIRQKIAELANFATYESLERLAQVLAYHICYEERQLFPLIEKMATAEQMRVVHEQLQTANPCQKIWADEFWRGKTTTLPPTLN